MKKLNRDYAERERSKFEEMTVAVLDLGRTDPLTALKVFLVQLIAPGKPTRYVEWDINQSEAEGFVETCKRLKALKPGERLRIIQATFTLPEKKEMTIQQMRAEMIYDRLQKAYQDAVNTLISVYVSDEDANAAALSALQSLLIDKRVEHQRSGE